MGISHQACLAGTHFFGVGCCRAPDSIATALGDLLPAGAAIGHRVENQRFPDLEPDFPGTRQSSRGWKCIECPAQVTGDHGHRRAGCEHAQARLERAERSIATAFAFGE